MNRKKYRLRQTLFQATRTRLLHKYRLLTALIIFGLGVYGLLLVLSPASGNLPVVGKSSIDLNTSDDKNDTRDRIQIEKINLEVPFSSEGGPELLEQGAWHRYPERGNPEIGGNFILSAHRFVLGSTPGMTRTKSPFYNLHRLEEGDSIRIFYNGQWYDYKVVKRYSVKPNSIEIEEPTTSPKLTLYTCSLKGSSDGRYVIDALPAN